MAAAKINDQLQARILRSKGRSLSEIATELNVSKSSVSVWVRNTKIEAKKIERLREKERIGQGRGRKIILEHWREYRKKHPKVLPNKLLLENRRRISDFFDTWNPRMAYVLGYFAADGCMYHSRNGGFYNGGFYIEFASTDLELLLSVKQLIHISNKIETKTVRTKENELNRRKQYKLRIVSKRAFSRLKELGFTPAKSLTLLFPRVPKKVFADFLRGYFDGDGHVHLTKRNLLQVGFTSGSRPFLEVLQLRLNQEAKTGLGSLHPHGSNWKLSYGTKDAARLYDFMYSTFAPCLLRKRRIFEKRFGETVKTVNNLVYKA